MLCHFDLKGYYRQLEVTLVKQINWILYIYVHKYVFVAPQSKGEDTNWLLKIVAKRM